MKTLHKRRNVGSLDTEGLMRAVIAAIIAWLGMLLPTLAAPIVLTGEVTYRERIALPPNAVLTISVVDLTLPGQPVRLMAQSAIASPGQVPLQFTFSFDDKTIDRSHQHAIVAEIASEGRIWFRTAEPYPLTALPPPQPPAIVVGLLAEPPEGPARTAAPLGSLAVSAEIFDTVWIAVSVAGRDLPVAGRPTLSITSDRRAGGIGGCNNYFTTAQFDASTLSFDPIVATRMACGARAMQQEVAYFAALAAVRGYALADGDLTLLDAAGAPLVRFARAAAR